MLVSSRIKEKLDREDTGILWEDENTSASLHLNTNWYVTMILTSQTLSHECQFPTDWNAYHVLGIEHGIHLLKRED